MNNNELVPASDMLIEGSQYLGHPIDRELVVSFGDTLMGIHPGAKDVGLIGMRAVAQLALATGANPLPGTNGIHAWVDNKSKICIQFGIGYWRTQADLIGGLLWVDRPRPMTEEERTYYAVNQGIVASICRAAKRVDVMEFLREMRSMNIEMSFKDAKLEMSLIGIGINAGNEYAKSGRPLQWSADLKAERDLLRKLIPVPQHQRKRLGGRDWDLAEFNRIPSDKDLDEDYDIDDANADLFDDDNVPDNIVEGETIDHDTGEIVDTPEDAPAPPPPPDPVVDNHLTVKRRAFHAVGVETYGDAWDDKRLLLVKSISGGKSRSSNDLDAAQLQRLIDGMKQVQQG